MSIVCKPVISAFCSQQKIAFFLQNRSSEVGGINTPPTRSEAILRRKLTIFSWGYLGLGGGSFFRLVWYVRLPILPCEMDFSRTDTAKGGNQYRYKCEHLQDSCRRNQGNIGVQLSAAAMICYFVLLYADSAGYVFLSRFHAFNACVFRLKNGVLRREHRVHKTHQPCKCSER